MRVIQRTRLNEWFVGNTQYLQQKKNANDRSVEGKRERANIM